MRNYAVRARASCVDLVVYEVMQFEVVHIADRCAVFKRFARSAVVKLDFAVYFTVFVDESALLEQRFDVLLVCAVENRRCDFPVKHMSDETEVNFENLSDIHTARNAQRVEHDLKRCAVCHKRHIFFGENSGHDALVAVTSRHLVADGDFSLLCDVYADEFIDAGCEFVFILSRKDLDVYYDTAFSVGNAQGRVTHFSCLLTEDCAEQSFFGRELRLALRSNFTDEDITGLDLRTYHYDAVFVKVFEDFVAEVGDISGDLFVTEFGVSALDFVLFDVN